MRASGIALLVAAALAAPAAGTERIRSFEVTIEVGRHDTFTVEETIHYDFGPAERRGILRHIPIRYGRGHAADYRIALDVEWVDDATGRVHPFGVSRAGRDVVVRIGDPDRTVSGEQTYRIRYRVRRGILYFDEHDELYWNVTGTEWPVSIDRARATVVLPSDVEPGALRLGCFTGPQGAVERDCTSVAAGDGGARIEVAAARPLPAGSGLTLVVGLPKGVLVEPSSLARLVSRIGDWVTVLSPLPFVVLGLMIALWRRHGRDPAGAAAIAVRYDPPNGMTPAELGTVVDERVHLADITATVLDLAVRGHLEIVEHETTRFLFLNDHDYELVHRKSAEPLRPFEHLLLGALFGTGERVRVSSLKNRFYRHVPTLQTSLYDAVGDGRWFASSPERVRRGWRVGAGAAVAAAVAVFLATESVPHALPVALTALVLFAFAPAMPRRTKAGRRAYEAILGFKEFLERVDRDRLERTGGRTAGRFERVLPYAVVLGVADQWADAFADVYTEPPSWFTGSRAGFNSRHFVSDVGRSLDTMGQTMVSQPKGGSGRSGLGGGGGGFSGGGFGGGGGRSW